MNEAQYQQFIRNQKFLARMYVNRGLDELCRRNGIEPRWWRRKLIQVQAQQFNDNMAKVIRSMNELNKAFKKVNT